MSPRVKTALVAGGGFLLLLLLGGQLGFAMMVALAAVHGVREYLAFGADAEDSGEHWVVAGWGGVIAFSFLADAEMLPGLVLALGVCVYLSWWVLGRGPDGETLARWGRVAGGWLLVAYFLGHGVWVRRYGITAVLFPLFVVWAGDIAAYYVGSAVGRRPLAPRVSPNKSVEGAVASVLAAGLVAFLAASLLPLHHGPAASVALGVGLNIFAQLGDLMESLLKRCAGVKDSGQLFPGHGGLLDRIDALLPVLPMYAGYLALFAGG